MITDDAVKTLLIGDILEFGIHRERELVSLPVPQLVQLLNTMLKFKEEIYM